MNHGKFRQNDENNQPYVSNYEYMEENTYLKPPSSRYGGMYSKSSVQKDIKRDYEIKFKDNNLKNLEKENAELKKEVHRLRKIEAGWNIGKGNQIEEIRIQNTYYVEQNNSLKTEIHEYKTKNMEMLAVIERLEEDKQRLEMQLGEGGRENNQEMTAMANEVERYRSEVKKLKIENVKLTKLKEENFELVRRNRSESNRKETKRVEEIRTKYKREIEKLTEELRKAERSKRGYREELERKESSNRTSRKRKDNSRYEELINEQKMKIKQIKDDNQSLFAENQKIKDENLRLISDMNGLRLRVNDNQKAKTKIDESQLIDRNNRIKDLQNKLDTVLKENKALNTKIYKLEASYITAEQKTINYSGTSRSAELEKLLSMYKEKLENKDEHIDKMRLELERLKDEIHSQKLRANEIEVKTRVSHNIENKKEMGNLRTLQIRNEELQSRIDHLELESQKLRDILQQSRVVNETNVHIVKEIHNDQHDTVSNKEYNDLALKLVFYDLEIERLSEQLRAEREQNNSVIKESRVSRKNDLNISWKTPNL